MQLTVLGSAVNADSATRQSVAPTYSNMSMSSVLHARNLVQCAKSSSAQLTWKHIVPMHIRVLTLSVVLSPAEHHTPL